MATGTRSVALALFLIALLAGPVAAADPTWVGIGSPPYSVTLEVGTQSQTIKAHEGNAVTTAELDAPTVVRVRRLSDCQPIVRFVAQPEGRYFIRFASDGTVRVEDLTGKSIDSGPGFNLLARLTCPALPDSSTAPASSEPRGLELLLLFGAVVAMSYVAFAGRTRSSRRPPFSSPRV